MDLNSTAQLLGNLGEFIGAIAVVGTLVYLAVQVKHSKGALEANTRALDENRSLARASFLYQSSRRWDEVIHNALGTKEAASIFVRGNRDLAELDEVEQAMYQQQIVPFLSWHMATKQVAEDGYLGLGTELMDSGDRVLAGMLSTHPGMRAYWDTVKWTYPQADYVDELVARVGKSSPHVFGESFAPDSPPIS